MHPEKSKQGPEDQTINNFGEAEQKYYKILLFYWGMIHDSNGIIPVIIAINVLGKAEKKSKQFHDILQVDGPRRRENKGIKFYKTL